MLLISYSTDYLYRHFSNVNIGAGAFMLVVDDQHRLIFHPDRSKIGWPVAPEFGELLQGSTGSFTKRLGQSEVLLSFENFADKDWHIISVTPMETLLAPVFRLRRLAGVILLVMMASILVFLRFFISYVVKPIEDIAEGFKEFESNKLTAGWRMPRPKSLEAIKDLTQWFNIFLANMERRQDEDVRLRIAATAFESHDAMFVSDARHVILQANSALSVMTGYPQAELVGHTPDIFSAHRQGTPFFDDILRAIENDGAWQGEVLNRRKDGELYPAWLAASGVRDENNHFTHFIATLTDITQRKANENEIRNLAFYDPLTGLANRRLMTDRLLQAMLDCPRRKQSLALMFLDLDKFKNFNDTLGHDIGDALLKRVGQRLVSCVRDVDTVARLGGDEFVVLIEGLDTAPQEAAAHVQTVALKILRTLAERYDDLGGAGFYCSASMGITQFSEPGYQIEELMKQADIALYQAKEAGRNTLRFFDPDMQSRIMARASLEKDLRQGLLRSEFRIYFQVKVDAQQQPIGAEVLVRWQHTERGLVSPASFIGLAEESGLIVPLGRLVFGAACAQLHAWAVQPDRCALSLSVNVSPKEFLQPDFVASLLGILDDSGADPDKLTVEITENMLVENLAATVEKMTALRRRGISFSIDDFGTGYSSLGYLKRMPLRELKIDRSFVRDMLGNTNDASIVRIVIALGNELGLDVVAEGIETTEQFDFLKINGCRTFQGYLFGAPMSLEEFEALLDSPTHIAAMSEAAGDPVHR
jgi:diguanylate cyclase (GGDEF)-like protein/PAS domain S-box-containing protein